MKKYEHIQQAYTQIEKIKSIEKEIVDIQGAIETIVAKNTESFLNLGITLLDEFEEKRIENLDLRFSGWFGEQIDTSKRVNKQVFLNIDLDEATQLRVLRFIHEEKQAERLFYVKQVEEHLNG